MPNWKKVVVSGSNAELSSVTVSQTLEVNAISAGGTLGTSGQVLSSTGTDTQWITNSGGGGVSNELAIAYAIALG